MGLIFFAVFVVIPASIMSAALWLVMKKTKVEGAFLQIFFIAAITSLVNIFPLLGHVLSSGVLFLLLYKWEGIKFWPKVKLWPDSIIVLVVGWGVLFAVNRLPLIIIRLVKSNFAHI